ncbi:YaaL family protein [Oceanobacillus halotolerans]|uniref:YaaL family protein n=1 Tax=Oceanobacillus halotolerans TaxID=2663380 RepID=UPI0013D36B6B|nr:YaaL family protein [Oceanobacillus halotolerans]
MARKKKKKQETDEQLLEAIFTTEQEWKQLEALLEKSIEPTIDGYNQVAIAQAKYMFLLREARHRKISAIGYR